MFLVNPASANGSTGRRWPELAARAAALGIDGETLLSERPGHLSELAGEAVAGGATSLVAVGGDGTAHEVVNGLAMAGAEGQVELALIPLGTGMDLARQLNRVRPGMPIVLYTGFGGGIPGGELAGAGIRALLAKPVEPAQLLEALAAALAEKSSEGLER